MFCVGMFADRFAESDLLEFLGYGVGNTTVALFTEVWRYAPYADPMRAIEPCREKYASRIN